MVIRKVKRSDIDLIKYDACINAALNYVIYAESWYLDIVTDLHWDCLVYGDYEVVMPLPYRKKLGIFFILQPAYCQQLGVFYTHEIVPDLFQKFQLYLHRLRVRAYCFNEDNTMRYQPDGILRNNHLLPLKGDGKELIQKMSNDRHREIRKLDRLEATFELTQNIDGFEYMLRHEYDKKMHAWNIVKPLLHKLFSLQRASLYQVKFGGEIETYRLFVHSKNRRIILFSARKKRRTSAGAPAWLLNKFMQDNCGGDIVLDFEGSDLPGVKYFNESLGANVTHYTLYANFFLFEKLKKLKHFYFGLNKI